MHQAMPTSIFTSRFFFSSSLPPALNCRWAARADVQELKSKKVSHVVRVCDPTYDKASIVKIGIEFHVRPTLEVKFDRTRS